MTIFIVIVAASVIGGVAVFLLLKKDASENDVSLQNFDPATQPPTDQNSFNDNDFDSDQNFEPIPGEDKLFKDDSSSSSAGNGLLSKLAFWKKNKGADDILKGMKPVGEQSGFLSKILSKFKKTNIDDDFSNMEEIPDVDDSFQPPAGSLKDDDLTNIPEATPFPSLRQHLESEEKKKPKTEIPETGTSSLKTQSSQDLQKNQLTADEQKNIDQEINSSLALDDLKNKHNKLEQLVKEKNAELEKIQKALDSEINNRKEFNKVKDLLEKELKEIKDKGKILQKEVSDLQQENQSFKQQIAQLEEKNKALLAESENTQKNPEPDPEESADAPQEQIAEPKEPSVVIPSNPEATESSEASQEKTNNEEIPEQPTNTDDDNEVPTRSDDDEEEDTPPEQVSLPKDPITQPEEAVSEETKQPETPPQEEQPEKSENIQESNEKTPTEAPEIHASKDYLETLNDLNNEASQISDDPQEPEDQPDPDNDTNTDTPEKPY